MFRDRTNLFLSYRQGYPHHPKALSGGVFTDDLMTMPDEQQGLMVAAPADEFGIEMDNLPPSWVDISDQVDEILAEVKEKCQILEGFHKKNMLPGFDDRTHEEERIEQLTFEITSALHKCQSLVKNLDSLTKNETDPAEKKMATNMKVALATKVQETSSHFRKMQSSYMKALKTDSFPSIDIKPSSNPYASVQQQEEDLDVASAQSTLQQSSMLVTSEDENLRQRENEITKLAQGIIELADIFKDLQTMVIDQGTLLDRIDYNVETMYTNVVQADKELIKGSGYQKRTQKCKIILLLVLLVVALIIILIVKPKHHGSNSSPEPPKAAPQTPAPESGGSSNGDAQ